MAFATTDDCGSGVCGGCHPPPPTESRIASLAGHPLAEARAMATDAIQGYCESLGKDGEPIPKNESITEQLAVEIA
jgi:predicted RNase H-like HicB family nuclease